MHVVRVLLAVCLTCGTSAVSAGEVSRATLDPHSRAGCPLNISPWALIGPSPAYPGYYVGGGAPCGGQPRAWHEGTWGWDYQGTWFQRWVRLDWWHGRRQQGGSGQYESQGRPQP